MEQFVDVATAKYEVGKSSQADLLKAKTELSKLQEAEIDATRNVEKARAELRQQLGREAEVEASAPVPSRKDRSGPASARSASPMCRSGPVSSAVPPESTIALVETAGSR